MNPLIDDLDASLAEDGQDATLRRVYGQAPHTANSDVDIRCTVRAVSASEIASGISETNSNVIMSPTEIANAQWPGGERPSAAFPVPSLPRRLDRLIVDGRTRSIEVVNPVTVGGELVRIELRILG